MKVFISWSGSAERVVAEALREAITVLCAGRAEVFVSSQDIPKGARGINAIGQSLSGSDYGLVLVSAGNQEKPWINYEAGALAKSLEAPVSTVLLDLIPSDVTGPLAAFQATKFDSSSDMRDLLTQIAVEADPKMPTASVAILFESVWPGVRDSWKPSSQGEQAEEPRRGESDMLAELIDRMRRIEANQDREARRVDHAKESVSDQDDRRLWNLQRHQHEQPASIDEKWFDQTMVIFTQCGVDVMQAGRTNSGVIRITVADEVSELPSQLIDRLRELAARADLSYRISGAAMRPTRIGLPFTQGRGRPVSFDERAGS